MTRNRRTYAKMNDILDENTIQKILYLDSDSDVCIRQDKPEQLNEWKNNI